MIPDQLLEQLKTNANARKQRSLNIIHQVCREQHKLGSRDFSVATIGRLSEGKGGPKAQSIRNKRGEDFRALISAWANHTGGSMKKQSKPDKSPVYALLDKIPDPAVRAVFGTVLAENTKLKGQVNLLKRQSEVVIDQRSATWQPQQLPQQTVDVLPPFIDLTDSEIEALTHAISDKLMKTEGWKVEANGRVKNVSGRTLYRAGYITAIKKILSK